MLDSRQPPKGIYYFLRTYFRIGSGKLDNPDWIRHRAIFVQLTGLFLCIVAAWMWEWNVSDTWGLFWLIMSLYSLGGWIGTFYFGAALFFSLRDNLPKMVTTKNSMGLFLFTLLFFETAILCFLFWFLAGALWFTSTPLCSGPFCSGLVGGMFAYVNVVAAICIVVVIRAKRMGISLLDAFGL